MKELAVCERYIYARLKAISLPKGWAPPQVAPFDLADGQDITTNFPLPILYFRNAGAGDRNAVGPGPRLMSWADYEIGVFHGGNTFGAEFKTSAGTATLLDVLGEIDNAFQNYTPPINQTGLLGRVYAIERQFPVRMSERYGGKLFRRDGGIYRFDVEADHV